MKTGQFRLTPHVERVVGEVFRCLPFNPKFAIRNPKLLIVLLSLSPLLLCFPAAVHAQWEPDVRLTFNDSSSLTSYNNARCIAASPGGVLHVVWEDRRDRNAEIYYKRSTDEGRTWMQDSRLTLNPASSWYPTVTAAGSCVHVVWADDRNGTFNSEIYYKLSSDQGTSWSQDRRLTYDSLGSGAPTAVATGDLVHLSWFDNRDGNAEIYYKRSTDQGITWSSDTRLTLDTAGSLYPSIAAESLEVHLVWQDWRDGGSYEIYYKRSSDGGTTWLPDARLTYDINQSMAPSIAVSGSDVHVAWVDDRSSPFWEIYYKRSTDRGVTWSLDTCLTPLSRGPWLPSVSVSGFHAHMVWLDQRDGNPEIYYKHTSNRGTSWSQDTRLTDDPSRSDFPSLTLADSMVHVVWSDERNGNAEVYYKRNPTGNSGVGESSGSFYPLTSNLSFSVVPNPFTSFTTLPGHEAERFALYDISGRKVGTYKGDRIGEGLGAGVYFLRPVGQGGKPLRVVKIR